MYRVIVLAVARGHRISNPRMSNTREATSTIILKNRFMDLSQSNNCYPIGSAI